MKFASQRTEREWRTIAAMIAIYCRAHHAPAKERLCSDCQGLLEYAARRLDRCVFGVEKPTCVRCPIHCYQPERREQVRDVMRFAGPRMLWQHPWLALMHFVDGRRRVPEPPGRAKASGSLCR